MLISTAELKKLFCKMVKQGKKKVEVCTYPEAYYFDQTLYAGVVGLILSLIFLVISLFVFFLNSRIKNDFVKCFATAISIPLTFGGIIRIIQIIFGMANQGKPSFAVDFFTHVYTVCITAAFITALFGIICFIYSHTFVLCTGQVPDSEQSWANYFTVQIIGWLLAGSYHLFVPAYRRMQNYTIVAGLWIAVVIAIITIISGVSALICCRPRKRRDTQDPVVARATTRLIFAILFVVVVAPVIRAIFFYSSEAGQIDNDDEDVKRQVYIDNYFLYRVLEFFAGPYMTLCILLLLPTYHNAVMGLFIRKGNGKWATKVAGAGSPLMK